MVSRILVVLSLFFLVSPSHGQINQAFKREVILQRIQNGRVVQEHIRRSQFVRDDQGRLVEQILFKTPNLKGISDKEVEEFASGRKVKVREGISQFVHYYGYREFRSTVEVKDVWDVHWPKGKVKVWFSSDFNSDRETLIEVLDLWNSLIPEVQFSYVGIAEHVQVCEGCLTVLRNPNLKDGGTLEYADRGDGLIVYGRIYLRRLDRNTLFTIFAHEIGHSLGLPHSDQGLMREDLPKGKRIVPSQVEVDLVRKVFQ